MAAKKEESNVNSVEELKAKYDTTDVIFSGVCAKYNWHAGKMMPENEYVKAVADFLRAPLGRR